MCVCLCIWTTCARVEIIKWRHSWWTNDTNPQEQKSNNPKLVANFSNRGVLASYLQLCDQDHCDHWEDHTIEMSLLTMITEDQDY